MMTQSETNLFSSRAFPGGRPGFYQLYTEQSSFHDDIGQNSSPPPRAVVWEDWDHKLSGQIGRMLFDYTC